MGTQIIETHSYTIREASTLSGLAESTLRYYETIGIIAPVQRDKSSKHRIYSEDDLNTIDTVACLNATGMSLADMKKYLSNRSLGDHAPSEQLLLLEAQKQRLKNEASFLKTQQQYVDIKIAYWRAVADSKSDEISEISDRARALASVLKHEKR